MKTRVKYKDLEYKNNRYKKKREENKIVFYCYSLGVKSYTIESIYIVTRKSNLNINIEEILS